MDETARLDKVAVVALGRAARWALAAGALVIAAIVLFHPAPVLFGALLAVAAGLSVWAALSFYEPDDDVDAPLDLARARARASEMAAHAPPIVTVARETVSRPLRFFAAITLPIALDALAGQTGAVSALAAGLLLGGVVTALLLRSHIRQFEREAQQTLLTEPISDPLPARRYFTSTRP